MTHDLPTAYRPADIESRWYDTWERQGLFTASPHSDAPAYSIVIPPPNVTGALHMGHAFGHTLQDACIRRARMMGCEALWLPGTDHAGIGTQNVVERELAAEGTNRHELGRDAFVARVWDWKKHYGGRILDQMRRLGDSCDWGRERFTLDAGLSRAVRSVFVRWFDEGIIYRGNRIINWCPRCTTALSDIEVEHKEVAGELITFRYPFADGQGHIAVATTRIETMLGDTGVSVHPDDERYKDAVGRQLRHPFFPDRPMPVVADDEVDPGFGTGAVKATPAHDLLDFAIAERHGLDVINILDERAHLNASAGRWDGLDRFAARSAVLKELNHLGFVDRVERPYIHSVGHCSRCGTETEPWLSEQWFVRMEPLAGPAIDVVREGRIKLTPERFVKAYLNWMENIRDWCISRQLWWGHRIPVWYCRDCGNVFAAIDDPQGCNGCSSQDIFQDPDVLDTWFSSQLWPFSTLGWPEASPDLDFFYPTTLLVTGYDILYLWVARMIFAGVYFTGNVPFKEVLLHGIVRDFEGKKMSKSVGNVVDPLDMIERYGADALRFSLAFAAVPGNDTNLSEERVEGARNFANKLWNASRFVFLSIGEGRPALGDPESLGVEDRWILSRLDEVIGALDEHLGRYEFAEAMRELHRFVWSEYCDWYIELAKLKLSDDRAMSSQAVLIHVLDRILRLLHPVMPFITEELWSRLWPEGGSIMSAAWPVTGGRKDARAEGQIARFTELVTSLRRFRAEHAVPSAKKIRVEVAAGDYASEIDLMRDALLVLAKLASVELVDRLPNDAGRAGTITDSGIEALVDLDDVIDLDAEKRRIAKRLQDLDEDIGRAERKLTNAEFVAKAPGAVVGKERAKLGDALDNKAKLEAQLAALDGRASPHGPPDRTP
ncbi:MAG: valine--tRNA ligase [Actinomycetota bacterium]|nr:valine--tRNA ligase [Actinomycetota bacterium]